MELNMAVAHPSDPGAQNGNMKGAQCEPSFLVAAHPSDPEAQKEGNMKGTQREPQLLGRGPPYEGTPIIAQLLCRGRPIRPRTQKEGSSTGAQLLGRGQHCDGQQLEAQPHRSARILAKDHGAC